MHLCAPNCGYVREIFVELIFTNFEFPLLSATYSWVAWAQAQTFFLYCQFDCHSLWLLSSNACSMLSIVVVILYLIVLWQAAVTCQIKGYWRDHKSQRGYSSIIQHSKSDWLWPKSRRRLRLQLWLWIRLSSSTPAIMRALRPSTRLAACAPTLCAVVVAMCACASIQCRERHFVALTRTQICLRALCTDLRWVELRWTKLNCSWVYASSAAVGMIAFNVWTAGQCMSSHLHGYSPGLSNTVPHVFLFKFFFFYFWDFR